MKEFIFNNDAYYELMKKTVSAPVTIINIFDIWVFINIRNPYYIEHKYKNELFRPTNNINNWYKFSDKYSINKLTFIILN